MFCKVRGCESENHFRVFLWLTWSQNLSANVSGIKLHMDGLEALVKIRGGICALPEPIPRRLVTWADSEGK